MQHWIIFFTGNAFIGLSKTLLAEGYKYILTEKLLCQDPLEQLFGQQRNATGSNNNPSMEQVLSFNRLHAVTKSVECEIAGNSMAKSKEMTVLNEPLPKRKKT